MSWQLLTKLAGLMIQGQAGWCPRDIYYKSFRVPKNSITGQFNHMSLLCMIVMIDTKRYWNALVDWAMSVLMPALPFTYLVTILNTIRSLSTHSDNCWYMTLCPTMAKWCSFSWLHRFSFAVRNGDVFTADEVDGYC